MGNDSWSDGNSSWKTFYFAKPTQPQSVTLDESTIFLEKDITFGIPSDLAGHSSEEEISLTSNNYEVQPSIPPCPDPDGNHDLQTNSRKRKCKTSSELLHRYRTRVKRLLKKVDVLKQGALFNKNNVLPSEIINMAPKVLEQLCS
nr:uncharacterized protein LOC113813024 [Penaeus vannamei]